jgi:signal peptidase II
MSETSSTTTAAAPLPLGQTGLPWLVLAAAVIVLDQLSKYWVVGNFELYQTLTLLPVLDFTRAHNMGAAFSFLAGAGGWQRWLFTALAIGVSAVIVVWLRRIDGRQQRWLAVGLTLIMGGALGNVIDRIRLGYVVDFVAVHWDAHFFPAFNLADSCITVGACLLLLDALLEGRRTRAA